MILISLLLFPKIVPTISDSTTTTTTTTTCAENQSKQQQNSHSGMKDDNPMNSPSATKTTTTTTTSSHISDDDYVEQQLRLASKFYKLLEIIETLDSNINNDVYVENHDSGNAMNDREHVILSHWMKLIGMDHYHIFMNDKNYHLWNEKVGRERNNNNWLEELHRRSMALAPDAFWKVYTKRPNKEEFRILMFMDEKSQEMAKNNQRKLQVYAFREHRERGLVSRLSHVFGKTILLAIQRKVSYATPNEQALRRIADYAPLLEVGAGTGYWSAILQQRGVDILPYDIYPPNKDKKINQNIFFTNNYTDVAQGSCSSILNEQDKLNLAQRTLLIIWPNNPDNVDNLKFFINDPLIPNVWDADCLSSFIDNGGTTVIFVGEREGQIPLMNHDAVLPDSGMSATRKFQNMLKDNFIIEEQIDIPTWWNVDDLTIWTRRNSNNAHSIP